MADEISNVDFVNSFLKAARLRKIAAVVVYGATEGGKANLRLVSNAGEGPTKGFLAWLRNQPEVQAELTPEDPAPAAPENVS